MAEVNLTLQGCRDRQQRLLAAMASQEVEAAAFCKPDHIHWLTGVRLHPLHAGIALLYGDGHCLLVAPDQVPDHVAADNVVTFATNYIATLRDEIPLAASLALREAMTFRDKPKRVGIEGGFVYPHMAATLDAEQVDIEPELWELRRFKHDDELAMLRKAIEGTELMYTVARKIIEPGINELEVYRQLYGACVQAYNEPPMKHFGNDFQCGGPGGPPRNRAALDGELYILDLGPCYRGYCADNARTIAVGDRPTEAQHDAWTHLIKVFDMVEADVKPGVSCKGFYEKVHAHLDGYLPGGFPHHLGHGFGLHPHERPRLNPNWDDTFREGDTFTVEPGLYSEELAGGMRIENNYRVTTEGVELLTDFPLELT